MPVTHGVASSSLVAPASLEDAYVSIFFCFKSLLELVTQSRGEEKNSSGEAVFDADYAYVSL